MKNFKSWIGVLVVSIASSLPVKAADLAQGEAQARRMEFLRLINRPRVDLAPKEDPSKVTNGITQIHFSFASDAEQRVPGILLKRIDASGKLPVVIVLHGTGGNKEGQTGLLSELAGKGFIGVAIDGRYHGERTKSGKGAAEYQEAILRTYRTGVEHPFLYDTVWDVMRLIDYLETRSDIDPKRIGMIGFSKGGMETYLAAAVDPRVAVAVPCIGVQSFRWALENDSWKSRVETIQTAVNSAAADAGISKVDANFVRKFYDKVVPGIYSQFDGPAMLPLIAPRPLLVINGDSDPRTPLPGVRECTEPAERIYRASQAGDKFELLLQKDTGHKVTSEAQRAALMWFSKWLQP